MPLFDSHTRNGAVSFSHPHTGNRQALEYCTASRSAFQLVPLYPRQSNCNLVTVYYTTRSFLVNTNLPPSGRAEEGRLILDPKSAQFDDPCPHFLRSPGKRHELLTIKEALRLIRGASLNYEDKVPLIRFFRRLSVFKGYKNGRFSTFIARVHQTV